MADKAISELVAASEITGTDLFVLEQAGTAKRLSGQTLTTFLLKIVEAHGGIVSINKTGTSGLVDTYTITMADLSTTTFTVKNGAKGDKGDNSYVHVKYSSSLPTKDSDIYDTPDNYMGIYSGNSKTAPTTYTSYKWFRIKGAKGDTGSAANLVSQSVRYQASTSGTVIPDGAWLSTIPAVTPGQYLWTQSMLQFNTGAAQIAYSVSRFGIDGSGSVVTVNSKSPDEEGNVVLTAAEVGAIPDADGAVATGNVATAAITTNKINDSAVTTAKIAGSAVTEAKVASNAVTEAKVKDAAITAAKIAYGALVTVKMFSVNTSNWTENSYGTYNKTVTLSGVDPAKHIGILMLQRTTKIPDVDTEWSFTSSMLEIDEEKIGCIFGCKITAVNELTFTAKEIPSGTLYLTLAVIHI